MSGCGHIMHLALQALVNSTDNILGKTSLRHLIMLNNVFLKRLVILFFKPTIIALSILQ
tara:strand:- start:525 stop:701 length:177 start_codon:yes stop_codon:yes gene_type:complete